VSKDSRIQLRAAIEAIGSMRKRYKKEALKRCDEMFAEGYEKGLQKGRGGNSGNTNHNRNNTNNDDDNTKIIHVTLDQTYNMLKHSFQSKHGNNNNITTWNHDEVLNILKTTMRDVAKKVQKRKSFIASTHNNSNNNAEQKDKQIQTLHHELDKMSHRHEKDKLKIKKLEKELEEKKKVINDYRHMRAKSNTSQQSNSSNNVANIRHVSFTPSTTPIRLNARELNLPPLWLELVHAHLNATSKVSVPWRVSVYQPRRMDSGTNASAPFMAYDVLSNLVGDESSSNVNNIVDGHYVPWYATISNEEIESWKKNKNVLRPVVHRRFKEFEWLYYRMKQQFNGSIVPLLPPKRYSFMESKFNTEFIESRKNALNQWLIYVASHPLLSTSLDLRSFLSTNFSMDSPLLADNIMLKTKSTLTNEHNKLSTDVSIKNLLSGYKFPRSLEAEAEKAGTKAFDASSACEDIGSLVGDLGKDLRLLGSNIDHCSSYSTSPSSSKVKTDVGEEKPQESGGIFWGIVGDHYVENIKSIYNERNKAYSSISNLYLFWGTQLLPEVRKSYDVPIRESSWHDKLGVAGRTGAELRELQKQYTHVVGRKLGNFAREMKASARKERKEWETILKQLEETPTPKMEKKYYDGWQQTYVPSSQSVRNNTLSESDHDATSSNLKRRPSTKNSKTPPRKSATASHSHTRANSNRNKNILYGFEDDDNNTDDLEDVFTKAKEEETPAQREENKKKKEEALRRKRERGAKLRAKKREQAGAERAALMKQREEEGAKKREELKRQMEREREQKEKSLAKSRRESLKQQQLEKERKLEQERKRKESRRKKYEEKMKHGLFADDQDEGPSRSNSYNPGIFTNLYSGKEKPVRSASSTNYSNNNTKYSKPTNRSSGSHSNANSNGDINANGEHTSRAYSSNNDSSKSNKRDKNASAKDKSWDGDNWLEATTKDGRVYYYHRNTRSVRWDKPPPHIAKQMDERKKREEINAEKRRRQRLDALRKAEEDKKEYNNFKIRTSAKVQKRVQNWSCASNSSKKLKSLFELLNTIHLDMPELVSKPLPGAKKIVHQNIDNDPFGYSTNKNNNVDAKDLKKMYRVALLKIHPDRIGKNVSPETRLLAEQVFGVINKQAKANGL